MLYRPFAKTPLLLALLAVIAAVAVAPAQAQDDGPAKIAVVNLDYIVAQSPAGKALQAKLEQFQQEVRSEVQARTESARDIRQRIAEGANSLSEDKLAELQQEYEDATIAIRRYQDDKQREGQKMQTEGLREIEKELQPVFEKVRDEGGYDLILNNVPGVVVMAGERIDITQEVVDQLNAASSGS